MNTNELQDCMPPKQRERARALVELIHGRISEIRSAWTNFDEGLKMSDTQFLAELQAARDEIAELASCTQQV